MFDIDLRSLYFSFILLLLVCLGVIVLLWFQTRKRFSGMDLLVFYVFSQLIGVSLITFRGVIPDSISIILANIFVVGGSIVGYVALERFVGLKTPHWRYYLFFPVFLGIQIVFTYVQNDQHIRSLNVGVSLMLISFDSAFLLLYRVGKLMRKITKALGFVFLLLVLVGLVRIIMFVLDVTPGYDYFHAGAFEAYVALLYQISFFLLIFFLSLAVNKRLINEIGEQEEKFSKAFKHSPYGNKRVENIVVNFRRMNGEPLICEFTSEVILISEELCLLSSINDITEQKKNENELMRSQSMLRRFASHLQIVGEEEKMMLATQIDNELNQTLVALKMDIGILKQRLKDAEDNSITVELFQKLDDVNKVVGNSLNFSLKLMSNLRNEVLYMMGFVEAMKLFVDDFSSAQSDIKCHIDIGKLTVQPDQKQSTSLYRMLESAMSNVASHSKATEVIISLHSVDNKLELEIADNGVGFEYNELIEYTSHGLMLMRERTKLLDGEMFLTSAPTEGTTIKIVVPLV